MRRAGTTRNLSSSCSCEHGFQISLRIRTMMHRAIRREEICPPEANQSGCPRSPSLNDETRLGMSTIKAGACTFFLMTFLSISLQAQTFNSRPVSKISKSYVSGLNNKARSGNTEAQVRLGLAYQFGEGVDKNFDEAIKWFHIAAEQG